MAAATLAAAAPAAEPAPAPAAPAEPAPKPVETLSAATEAAPAASPSTAATAPAPVAEAEPAPVAAPPPARSTPAASAADSEDTHLVHHGETLSQIAAGIAGEKVNAARTHSWMLAIYQANPRAFQNNMNVMRSGAVLRIPDAEAAAAVSPSEATSEIRRQYAAWRSAGAAPAETAAQQPGRLKLVTPSESASAGAAPGASAGESGAAQGRVHELEGQLAESKRLLEMKDAELARLQAQLAAKQSAPATPPVETAPQAAAAPPAAPPASPPAPAEQPPVAQATPPSTPPVPEEKPAAPAAEAPPPVAATAPPPAVRAPTPAPPPESGGFLGTLAGYWWVLLIAAVAAAAVAAFRMLRARRASQFDDSLGRLAVAGADVDLGLEDDMPTAAPAAAAPAPSGSTRFAAADTAVRSKAAPAPEPSFVVEETGTHERQRLTPAGAPAAPSARHVASDETISSETAINLDQGDPLAEADFHMAYGLYDQAADLIRIAISREPGRRDLKLKLLEVFFVWGNKDQFLQTARELAESRADAAPGEWEKILIMGKQLAPEDPLFSGGAVTGAAAGGVDLDLEGGQSRVDFDLLGEPMPGEAQQGVDLDIGMAVGDHHEATTSVTDRNVALAENSFLGTTGTTRQMTARMRQDAGTTEMEGPTVEQPALPGSHQPTIRQKVETAMRKSVSESTAELAIDDLGLDIGAVDTVDQPGPASAAASSPDAPTLVAGLDDRSRKLMDDAQRRAATDENPVIASTGAWSFDQNELEAALTQTSVALTDPSDTSRLAALRGRGVDVDLSDATGTHAATATNVDLDVGTATGTHGNGGLDLDVGTATVPDAGFAATQRLASEELALPDLEPVTMSEVGTKLDLARAYMDMGDPDGARNILEEVLSEGSAAQKQEAQRLMESLP
jgi:pilus assembly protein FimV